jgi:tRNA-2-methylthio-N6-dimethylallyladenosine synthase
MKIYLETMGCQMNQLDSELAAGILRSAGHEMSADRRGAEAVIYNTCAVRGHAEDKLFSRLGAEGQRKAAGRRLIVGVMGCVAQELGAGLRKRYPRVDFICAPGQLHRLPALLDEASRGVFAAALDAPRRGGPAEDKANQPSFTPEGCDIANSPCRGFATLEAAEVGRDTDIVPSPSRAYVRVMRGCDKFCAYCVVPFVRGREQSRPPHAVLEEVRRLVGSGRAQITLLGQTVNSYRWRGGEGLVRFSDLLARVSAVEGLRRLRFVTSHPLDFGDDILGAMRDLPNVCPYIHCPAQSGSDSVLSRMKRGYTRGEYDDFVARARAIVPGVVLSGDFIVGFPGETEADHASSADLIRRAAYKNTFIFKYSSRPGTLAARKYADDIPDAVKRRRNAELLAVQKDVGSAHHAAYVGLTVEALVEGASPRETRRSAAGGQEKAAGRRDDSREIQLVGRTAGDHIVVFDGAPELAGRHVQVEITAATSLTLIGRRL